MESYRLIQEAMGRFVKPPPRAKFQKGERVKVTGEEDPDRFKMYHGKKRLGLLGKEGIVVGYDYYPGSYSKFLVKFDDGTKDAVHSHFLIPAQSEGRLALIDKVIKLGMPDYQPGMKIMGDAFFNKIKMFGYTPATESDFQEFKKNLLKSSPFQNNLSRGMKTVKSIYNEQKLRIHLIGVMTLYPQAPEVTHMADAINEYCMPVFDKTKPVFYFWYASPNAATYNDMKDGFLISFPEIVGWAPDTISNNPSNLDQKFNIVGILDGNLLEEKLKGVEALTKGKKLGNNFDNREAALSLHRIATMQTIKSYKGVQQQDFDALMGL